MRKETGSYNHLCALWGSLGELCVRFYFSDTRFIPIFIKSK